MKHMKIILAALVLLTSLAYGDDQIFNIAHNEYGEMSDAHIEASGGVKLATYHSPRVVVGVRFSGFHEDGKPLTGWRLFAVKAEIGMAPGESGRDKVASYEVSIAPLTYVTDISEPDLKALATMNFGQTTRFSDNDLAIRGFTIKVFEAKLDASEPTEQQGGFIMNALANAVGYSVAEQLDKNLKKKGGYLAGLGMQLGYEWMLTALKLPKHMRFRVTGHGNFEAATTHMRGSGYGQLAVVSRGKYAESSLYVKSGGAWSTFFEEGSKDDSDRGGAFVMTGLNIVW